MQKMQTNEQSIQAPLVTTEISSLSALGRYLEKITAEGKDTESVINLVNKIKTEFFTDKNLENRITGLLAGHVQSGKTAHVLGIIANAIDNNMKLIVYLTSDNVDLYAQTYQDCMACLTGNIQIFSENETAFASCKRQCVVVLKKNGSVLNTWLTEIRKNNPGYMLIVDDEADAASLDTKQNDLTAESKIHELLCALKKLGSGGSLYLQVTATPQATLLLPSEDPLSPTYWAVLNLVNPIWVVKTFMKILNWLG